MITLPSQFQGKNYSLYIGENLLNNPALLLPHLTGTQVAIVTHAALHNYLIPIKNHLQAYQCDEIVLEEGEAQKSLATIETILTFLTKRGHQRSTTLIALGGGVISDITGFASAIYLRGVNCIYIPTTLLAQVDATLGGKCAVNHPLGKNLIGSFKHPSSIIIDVATLQTLPEREFNAGLAEAIKHAITLDEPFFYWLQAHIERIKLRHPETLIKLIHKSLVIKQRVIASDEEDLIGKRAVLNFGHTFAHALEFASHHRLLHGEAVMLGMQIATKISLHLGLLPQQDSNTLLLLLDFLKINAPPAIEIDESTFKNWLARDKKNISKRVNMILLTGIGSTTSQEVDWTILHEYIDRLKNQTLLSESALLEE